MTAARSPSTALFALLIRLAAALAGHRERAAVSGAGVAALSADGARREHVRFFCAAAEVTWYKRAR
jgi:hypothetical protein